MNDRKANRKLAQLFVRRQIADWENVLEALEEAESLEKTVKYLEERLRNQDESMIGFEQSYFENNKNSQNIGPKITYSGANGASIILPVKTPPKVFNTIEDIDAAMDNLELKM